MSELREIDVQQLAKLVQAGSTVIDVREQDEYESGHVPGAVFVPLSELADRAGDVPEGEAVLVICKSGGRSARVCEYLTSLGRDVTNVAGGTLAWIDAGFEVNTGLEP